MQTLLMIMPLVLTNNLVMSIVKWLSPFESNAWLRAALIVISLIGLITGSAVSGIPVNFDSIQSLGTLLIETLFLALASHYSFQVIAKA